MIGRRLADKMIDRLPDDVRAGDYWRVLIDDGEGERPMNVQIPTNLTGGVWMVAAPQTSGGFQIGTLTKHTVREHDDGTISVRPGDGCSNSIPLGDFHGFIERGVWA